MDKGAKGWLVRYALANHWRVEEFYDVEDLIQDGWLCYLRVQQKYAGIREPKHIMALFKTTYINHLHDLSNKQRKLLALINSQADYDIAVETFEMRAPDLGSAYFVPEKAPWYVHAFLRLLCSSDGPAKLRSRYRIRLSGIRELTHDRLCRLIGANPDSTPTLPDAIESYFQSL